MKINKNLLYFFLMLPIVIVVGIRGDTPDTAVYYRLFKTVDLYDLTSYSGYYDKTGVELGWGLFSKLVSLFTESSAVLFSLFSLIIFYIIYKTSRLVNVNYMHVMIFYLSTGYFFMQQFMQIRQAFAVSLAIYASLLLFRNKKTLSLVFFVLAILFHQIVFAFSIIVVIYFLISKRYDLAPSLMTFRILNVLLIVVGVAFIRLFLKDYAVSSFSRLESYSGTSEYGKEVSFFSPSNIKVYILFILLLLFTNNFLIKNKVYVFLVYIFTVGVALRLGFYDFAILSGRLSNIFLYVEIFLLPIILFSRVKGGVAYIIMAVYFLLILYVTWFYQASEYLSDSYFKILS